MKDIEEYRTASSPLTHNVCANQGVKLKRIFACTWFISLNSLIVHVSVKCFLKVAIVYISTISSGS